MSPKGREYVDRMWEFMREHVLPAEAEYARFRAERGHDDHTLPPVVETLKAEARSAGCGTSSCPT